MKCFVVNLSHVVQKQSKSFLIFGIERIKIGVKKLILICFGMVVHFYFDMLWNGCTLYLHLCKLVKLQWYEQAKKPVASWGCLENQVNYHYSRETWSRAK